MKKYLDNIEKETLDNENFRKVLFTGEHSQLVVMCLQPKEEIGMEIHPTTDQFFRIEQGSCNVILDGEEFEAKDDDGIIVTGGTEHNVINTSETETLKLYTIYSPPNHPDGTIHKNKAEADEYEKQH
jgi:mannose-6-phosphate isomerase-like protein (cupin superfamily)